MNSSENSILSALGIRISEEPKQFLQATQVDRAAEIVGLGTSHIQRMKENARRNLGEMAMVPLWLPDHHKFVNEYYQYGDFAHLVFRDMVDQYGKPLHVYGTRIPTRPDTRPSNDDVRFAIVALRTEQLNPEGKPVMHVKDIHNPRLLQALSFADQQRLANDARDYLAFALETEASKFEHKIGTMEHTITFIAGSIKGSLAHRRLDNETTTDVQRAHGMHRWQHEGKGLQVVSAQSIQEGKTVDALNAPLAITRPTDLIALIIDRITLREADYNRNILAPLSVISPNIVDKIGHMAVINAKKDPNSTDLIKRTITAAIDHA
jgi:hypothetical protein